VELGVIETPSYVTSSSLLRA